MGIIHSSRKRGIASAMIGGRVLGLRFQSGLNWPHGRANLAYRFEFCWKFVVTTKLCGGEATSKFRQSEISVHLDSGFKISILKNAVGAPVGRNRHSHIDSCRSRYGSFFLVGSRAEPAKHFLCFLT